MPTYPSPSAAPAAPQQRTLIYQSNTARDVTSEMDRLEQAYLKAFKRKPNVELFFSSWGTDKRPVYGLTIYYTADQFEEAQFMADNATPSPST